MSEKMELEILISMSEKNIKKVEESVKNLKRKTKKDRELELAINLAKVRTQYMELQAMIRKARKDGESEIAIRLQVEAEKMKLDLNEANRALRNLRNTGDETKSMLGKMFDNAGMSGFFSRFIGPAGIAGAVSGLFTLGQQVERTEIAFQQMTGSIEKGSKLFKEIREFAKDTPFGDGVIEATKLMMAMGFEAESILPTMKSIGEAVSAMGGSDAELMSVARALGQIQAKGKLSAEEVNQLAERGIGVWEILAKEMQKPVGELQKMAEKGEILAKDVLPMILKSFDENYGGMMDKMSDTAQGRLDELIATFRELVSELGKMLAPIFKMVLDGLLTVLNFFQSGVGKVTAFTVAIAGAGIGIATLITKIGIMVGVFTSSTVVIGGATTAVTLFGTAVKIAMGPIGWLIGGLSLLGGVTYGVIKAEEEAKKKQEELEYQAMSYSERIEHLKKKQEELNTAKENGSVTEKEYQEKMQESTKKIEEEKDMLELAQDAQNGFKDLKEKIIALKNKGDIEGLENERKKVEELIAHYQKLIKEKELAMQAKLTEIRSRESAINNATLPSGENFSGAGSLMPGDVHIQENRRQMAEYLLSEEYKKSSKEIEQHQRELDQYQRELADTEKALKELQEITRESQQAIAPPNIGGGGGRGSKKSKESEEAKKAKKAEEDLKKARTKAYDEAKKKSEKYQEVIVSTNKKLAEQKKKLEEIRKEATETIKDIEEKLLDEKTSYQEKLAKRYAEIIKEIGDTIGVNDRDSIFANLAKDDMLEMVLNGQISIGEKLKQELELIRSAMSEEELKLAIKKEERSETEKITEEYKKQVDLLESSKKMQEAIKEGRYLTNAEGGIDFLDENGNILKALERDQEKEFLEQAKKIQAIADEELKIFTEKNEKISEIEMSFQKERQELNEGYFEQDKELRLRQNAMSEEFYRQELERMGALNSMAREVASGEVDSTTPLPMGEKSESHSNKAFGEEEKGLEDRRDKNSKILGEYSDMVTTIETGISAVTKAEIDKRLNMYRIEEQRLNDLIAKRMQAGYIIASVPRQFQNVSNVINHNPTISVNATSQGNLDANALANTLIKKVQNYYKGVN